MKVAIFFGSKSDTEIMKGAASALKEFDIDFKAYVLSAHRVPERLSEVLKEVCENGCEVIIPVIGIPCNGAIGGIDALYSIVQMPKSVPVATVGINNSYNAGMLAVEILSIKYPEIKEKLIKYREDMKKKFIQENDEFIFN